MTMESPKYPRDPVFTSPSTDGFYWWRKSQKDDWHLAKVSVSLFEARFYNGARITSSPWGEWIPASVSGPVTDLNPAGYCPEVPFAHDGAMIFSLRQNGFRKGIPQMENDVWINIQSRTISQEQRDEIAKVIVDALNERFPPSE